MRVSRDELAGIYFSIESRKKNGGVPNYGREVYLKLVRGGRSG